MHQKKFSELAARLLSKIIFISLLIASLVLALVLLPILLFVLCLLGLSFLTLFVIKRFAKKKSVSETKTEKEDFTTTIEVVPINVSKSETLKKENGKIQP
ncbi:MAG: hypothetical protein ACSNEK_03770 [Parachlamydiaceae bacterium]